MCRGVPAADMFWFLPSKLLICHTAWSIFSGSQNPSNENAQVHQRWLNPHLIQGCVAQSYRPIYEKPTNQPTTNTLFQHLVETVSSHGSCFVYFIPHQKKNIAARMQSIRKLQNPPFPLANHSFTKISSTKIQTVPSVH